MEQKLKYIVRLRAENGGEHDRLIFAQDDATARDRAVVRARIALGKTIKEQQYMQFEVLSCNRAISA